MNTRGVFHGSREAAKRMTDGGVIVNIVSTAGFRGTARDSPPTSGPSTPFAA